MFNGVTASRKSVRRAPTQLPRVIHPLRWTSPGEAVTAVERHHAHNCLTCGAAYECPGPEEIGYCNPICQPCYWIELGSQLRIYQEVVTELRRKRVGIERRVGKAVCHSAAAFRRKTKTDASLLVAFGNLLNTQPATPFPGLHSEAQEGGLHE